MASQKKQRKRQQATPAKIVSAERIARAMELRKGGATYEMIGADLGVSTPRAFEIVNDALKALVAEPTEQVRKLEIERIDHMLSVVWATATNAMSETTVVDASLLDMILKAQALLYIFTSYGKRYAVRTLAFVTQKGGPGARRHASP